MSSPHVSMKSGKAGKGSAHASYIAGVGKYADREDVIEMIDRNMPMWAKDGADFFAAADKFERANGRTYTEIEAAIPREVADPIAYAIEYAEKLLGTDHPYRLAVHDKLAADGGRNVHMHLMLSERKLDGIEREREQFFKRASAPYRDRKTKQMMPSDPTKGGAAKDRRWNERTNVQVVRDGWQEFAKAHGIDLDLRSNAAKGLGAPEPKLGPEHPRADENPAREARRVELERLRAVRAIRAELQEINHQEKQHVRASRDESRHHQPTASVAEMRDVWGVNNVHDLCGPENLLQPDAPGDVQPQQAEADPAGLHQLATARAITDTKVAQDRAQPPAKTLQRSPAIRAAVQVPIMVDGAWMTGEQARDRRQKMEYTQQLEADLREQNAKAAARLLERADRLAEQVATGEKSPAVLSTANAHVKMAKVLEKIASASIEPPSPLSLADRLAASWQSMIDWIKQLGPSFDRTEIDKNKGHYLGQFVKIDKLHVIQKVGRASYSIHLVEDLDRTPTLGNPKSGVQYKNGLGMVTGEVPDRGDRGDRGNGR
jgi:hypothetical protein